MSLDTQDWENQRAFLAVLREGSLSAAARALQVAQPTIRRRLEALEANLGVVLFTRSPSGLAPTETARELGGHVEAMAAAADAFARAASADSHAATGTVRITCSEVIGAEMLPTALTELRALHPGLVIELSPSNRSEDLLRHEADIAVRMVRPAQTALVAQRVGVVRLGFFAKDSYLEKHGTPDSLAALTQHALIGPDRETADLKAFQALSLDLRRSLFAFRTDSHLVQLNAIRAGMGIGVCQYALARRDPTLRPVLADAFSFGLETWITMHEDLRHVGRVRTTFDHLVAAMTAYIDGQEAIG